VGEAERKSRLVRYEGKYQARWMVLKKTAFAMHVFYSHIDETATASSTEFCII
jgi:ribosomal silencing factor RsfS